LTQLVSHGWQRLEVSCELPRELEAMRQNRTGRQVALDRVQAIRCLWVPSLDVREAGSKLVMRRPGEPV
jgi:hypothetical protein